MNRRRHDDHDSPFARAIGRSRFVVVIAVIAVMFVALSLFILGAFLALYSVWTATTTIAVGDMGSTELTVRFLEIVTVMFKAVVFYLIGVGLYSLFIAPLNLAVALGVETLNDLEAKIVSVVVVILGVRFLEAFIEWENSMDVLMRAGATALVVFALVFFQRYTHKEGQEHKLRQPDVQERAKLEMFERQHERQEIRPEEVEQGGGTRAERREIP